MERKASPEPDGSAANTESPLSEPSSLFPPQSDHGPRMIFIPGRQEASIRDLQEHHPERYRKLKVGDETRVCGIFELDDISTHEVDFLRDLISRRAAMNAAPLSTATRDSTTASMPVGISAAQKSPLEIATGDNDGHQQQAARPNMSTSDADEPYVSGQSGYVDCRVKDPNSDTVSPSAGALDDAGSTSVERNQETPGASETKEVDSKVKEATTTTTDSADKTPGAVEAGTAEKKQTASQRRKAKRREKEKEKKGRREEQQSQTLEPEHQQGTTNTDVEQLPDNPQAQQAPNNQEQQTPHTEDKQPSQPEQQTPLSTQGQHPLRPEEQQPHDSEEQRPSQPEEQQASSITTQQTASIVEELRPSVIEEQQASPVEEQQVSPIEEEPMSPAQKSHALNSINLSPKEVKIFLDSPSRRAELLSKPLGNYLALLAQAGLAYAREKRLPVVPASCPAPRSAAASNNAKNDDKATEESSTGHSAGSQSVPFALTPKSVSAPSTTASAPSTAAPETPARVGVEHKVNSSTVDSSNGEVVQSSTDHAKSGVIIIGEDVAHDGSPSPNREASTKNPQAHDMHNPFPEILSVSPGYALLPPFSENADWCSERRDRPRHRVIDNWIQKNCYGTDRYESIGIRIETDDCVQFSLFDGAVICASRVSGGVRDIFWRAGMDIDYNNSLRRRMAVVVQNGSDGAKFWDLMQMRLCVKRWGRDTFNLEEKRKEVAPMLREAWKKVEVVENAYRQKESLDKAKNRAESAKLRAELSATKQLQAELTQLLGLDDEGKWGVRTDFGNVRLDFEEGSETVKFCIKKYEGVLPSSENEEPDTTGEGESKEDVLVSLHLGFHTVWRFKRAELMAVAQIPEA